MTFKELQKQAVRRLKEAAPPRSPENFDSPQWDVRLLTEYASGLNQTQLPAYGICIGIESDTAASGS